MRRRALIGAVIGAGLLVLGLLAWSQWSRTGVVTSAPAPRDSDRTSPPSSGEATFVGRQACAACHPRQVARWQGSHHDLAMELADEHTVLGDFADATVTHFGVTSTFFTRDGRFFVRTEGPDGGLGEYEIAYTFGVVPLQQYLIAFPRGRYQALSLAWDTRPREAGGQRWFHLYPDERIPPDDSLHWTRLNQTWNYMCAECHSTNLQKNYRFENDRYETVWSELDVSCEACHGPGSRHVVWAEAAGEGRWRGDGSMGLPLRFPGRASANWVVDPASGTATRSPPLASRVEVEACARCHSRRGVVEDRYVYGRPVLDTHRVSVLDEGLYYADGQIRDEVYVYGSFLQSGMYRAGVTCSDCHDPHTLRPRASGGALCGRCHLPAKFDTPSHHFHPPGSTGARCLECHMPARTYMVVDPRRDHSLRVPRPDLSVKLGTPNACTACHADRSPQWAADAVAQWYGPERPAHYGEALHAGRQGLVGAETALAGLVADSNAPPIARATAAALLGRYPTPRSLRAVEGALADGDALVRQAALAALDWTEPRTRVRLAAPLLRDPVRTVRLEAARVLVPVSATLMTGEQRSGFDLALGEYRRAQRVNADRPESHLSLGLLDEQLGRLAEAEGAYRTALRLDPLFVPAYVNLADHYRRLARDDQGEQVLRKGLAVVPDDASLHHALGLLLVRQKRLPDAIDALRRAAEFGPDQPRYGYVYGVALHSLGETDRALEVLRRTHERHPNDRELLLGLTTMNRERGLRDAAIEYAKKLIELNPEDPVARRLLGELEAMRP